MPRVAHFEIHASEPAKLAAYYRELFGWKMQHLAHMDYWLIDTSEGGEPGINGGLLQRRGPKPTDGQAVNAFMCTVNVSSVDAYRAKALKLAARRRSRKWRSRASAGWRIARTRTGIFSGCIRRTPTRSSSGACRCLGSGSSNTTNVNGQRSKTMKKTILLGFGLALGVAPAIAADEFSAADKAAIFKAAGFKAKGGAYIRCVDDSPSAMAGYIETDDLNGDGANEAFVRESSTNCYGMTAEAFVLVAKNAKGEWTALLDEVGIASVLDTKAKNGWKDIEVGGPGMGPFPKFRYNGKKYVKK